jgi:putative FmdB family regulatory protein
MPTYDYQCDTCGHDLEVFQSMKDAPLTMCPECNNATLRRVITGGTGIIFKGSGFYVNDSKRSSAGSKSAGSTGDASETAKSPEAAGSSETKSSDSGESKKAGGDSSSGSSTEGAKKSA